MRHPCSWAKNWPAENWGVPACFRQVFTFPNSHFLGTGLPKEDAHLLAVRTEADKLRRTCPVRRLRRALGCSGHIIVRRKGTSLNLLLLTPRSETGFCMAVTTKAIIAL